LELSHSNYIIEGTEFEKLDEIVGKIQDVQGEPPEVCQSRLGPKKNLKMKELKTYWEF